jgi:hypothetical protein
MFWHVVASVDRLSVDAFYPLWRKGGKKSVPKGVYLFVGLFEFK